MKKSILLVGHGSRLKSTEMIKVADLLADKYSIVETCYLSITAPDISGGIQKCIDQGAKLIIVIPYFLQLGTHVSKDLPKIIDAEQRDGVKIILGGHIGFHQKLAEIIIDRVEDADA